jgi:3-dehydroquinate synthase
VVKPPYPITIRLDALDTVGKLVGEMDASHRVAIITDERVGPLYAARIAEPLGARASVFSMPSGEEHKTRQTWARLSDEMLEAGFGRDTVVVALGGGVVGDVAGFVAATYMRGVPVVQVPTTLLAMVDASVGGKTGVDTRHGKNLVGAFWQPVAVVIDPRVLSTLPERETIAGFAEIIKHGVIADASYLRDATAFLEDRPAVTGGATAIEGLIRRSIAIKADVVGRDERESGLRKILNFGHTVGHAIEAACNYELLHGECVAIGMVAEARIAERIGVATKGTADGIQEACRIADLPSSLPDVGPADIVRIMKGDKKSRAGRVEFALPSKIGAMAGADRGWAIPVDEDVVIEVLSK